VSDQHSKGWVGLVIVIDNCSLARLNASIIESKIQIGNGFGAVKYNIVFISTIKWFDKVIIVSTILIKILMVIVENYVVSLQHILVLSGFV